MKITRCIPFKLTKSEPTEMFVSFYAEEIRYDYQVRFDVNQILHQELNYYQKAPRLFFTNLTYKGENLQAEIKFGASSSLATKDPR